MTRMDWADATIDTYTKKVEQYLLWCDEEERDSTALASADLYVDHLERSRGVHSARWAGRALRAYGKFLNEEYDEGNPFARLKPPALPQPTAKHTAMATEDDLAKLLDTCDTRDLIGLRDYALILTLAGTGLRRGEVTALTLDDVDLVSQTIRVQKGKTKAARRVVFMPDDVQGALLRYLRARAAKIDEEDAKYSPEVGGHPNPQPPYGETVGRALWITNTLTKPVLTVYGVSQMLKRKGDKVGVDVRAHGFRRRYAGKWMANGGTETSLMAQAGWVSPTMIAHYTKDTLEQNALDEARRLMARS
jgi:integrase/recombinase XerD